MGLDCWNIVQITDIEIICARNDFAIRNLVLDSRVEQWSFLQRLIFNFDTHDS